MRNIDELKQFKELLDSGVITQEEFDKKKKELLEMDSSSSENPVEKKPEKKPVNKALIKKILIIIGILAVLVAGFFIGRTIIEKSKQTKRAAALETNIQSIMDKYGLSPYTVKYVDRDYDVFAEGFESLTNGEALECLKALGKVSIPDPCGGDSKIGFSDMVYVHPGLDVEYSYWRVSTTLVKMNELYGGNYKKPGIYCNQYGMDCVFEYDN